MIMYYQRIDVYVLWMHWLLYSTVKRLQCNWNQLQTKTKL